MRYILFPFMPLPEPAIPLVKWPHFVDFAVGTSMCVVLLGAVMFIIFDRLGLKPAGLIVGVPALARIATVLPPLLAGWLAAGICELWWVKFFGAATSASATLTWIGICTGLWTALVGSAALALARWLTPSQRAPLGAAAANTESTQIQRKESEHTSQRR